MAAKKCKRAAGRKNVKEQAASIAGICRFKWNYGKVVSAGIRARRQRPEKRVISRLQRYILRPTTGYQQLVGSDVVKQEGKPRTSWHRKGVAECRLLASKGTVQSHSNANVERCADAEPVDETGYPLRRDVDLIAVDAGWYGKLSAAGRSEYMRFAKCPARCDRSRDPTGPGSNGPYRNRASTMLGQNWIGRFRQTTRIWNHRLRLNRRKPPVPL